MLHLFREDQGANEHCLEGRRERGREYQGPDRKKTGKEKVPGIIKKKQKTYKDDVPPFPPVFHIVMQTQCQRDFTTKVSPCYTLSHVVMSCCSLATKTTTRTKGKITNNDKTAKS